MNKILASITKSLPRPKGLMQWLKKTGLQLFQNLQIKEDSILNINMKKGMAIIVFSNVSYYFYYQIYSDDFKQQLYYSPSRAISRFTGRVAQYKIPFALRKSLFQTYSWFYEVNIEEMIEPDFQKYETFMDFFTREIKSREYSKNIHELISPADSRVLSFCEITKDSTLLVKNINYKLGCLLTGNANFIVEDEVFQDLKKSDNPDKSKLYSIILYLAPGDYHRFHSPCDIVFKNRCHVFGHLQPVKISHISKTQGVYETNERVSLFGQYAFGLISMVYVGAMNVGSIVLHFDDKLTTNQKFTEIPKQVGVQRSYHTHDTQKELPWYQRGLPVNRGQELGLFRLGSTIVIIFEAETVDWKVNPGQKLQWGETFAIVNQVNVQK